MLDVRAILFLDFDQTLTVNSMWALTKNGVNNIHLLNAVKIAEIFGTAEHIARIRQFLATVQAVPHLLVEIISNSWEQMITFALILIGVVERPIIIGRETIMNYRGKKSEYVATELVERNLSAVIYVDDNSNEREAMRKKLADMVPPPTLRLCCDGLKNGLSQENIDAILRDVAELLRLTTAQK
jgi:hypothetical protein